MRIPTMRSTLLTLDRRALAAVALFGTAMLAACDTDKTVAPTPTATPVIPTTSSEYVIPATTGTVIWRTINATQKMLISGAKFTVTGPLLYNQTFVDNDATDADTVSGQFRLSKLKPGSYTVCEVAGPTEHTIADPACRGFSIYAGSTTGVADFVSLHLPYLNIAYVNQAGTKIPGGVMIVKDSTGNPVKLVAQDGLGDVFLGDDHITVMLPAAGKFSICVGSAPAGYAISPVNTPCLTGSSPGNAMLFIGNLTVYPAPSAVFGVRDPFGNPVGPSTVTFYNPRSNTTITVTDNIGGDLDPAPGKFLVKLPFPTSYTLCQTKAPAGRLIDPTCKTVDLSAGNSVWAGWFTDNEQQVYKP
jgi:hypothetical protein